MPPAPNELTEEELLNQCRDNFYLAATIQGRISYLLMSIHVANPNIFASLTDYDPTQLLFTNMVYGMTIHLFSRPSMTMIGFLHRLSFSILGSMMFNHSSMLVFEWVKNGLPERPYLATFMSFLLGRMMMVHILAYLYHVDTRNMVVGNSIRRDSTFETIYL